MYTFNYMYFSLRSPERARTPPPVVNNSKESNNKIGAGYEAHTCENENDAKKQKMLAWNSLELGVLHRPYLI